MGDALSVIVKPVCAKCNGGWMSRLERDVVGFFGASFRGDDAVILDPSRQERLATWATKTALLLGNMQPACRPPLAGSVSRKTTSAGSPNTRRHRQERGLDGVH